MTKTTNTKVRTAKAKPTANKPKSGTSRRSLSRILNPSSTRGKLLVYAITFALVGGVYMAFRSFAATPADSATLFFVKTDNTGSGTVELHTATAASGYKSADAHKTTRFSSSDANKGFWQVIGRDLYFIKICDTASGKMEVQSATAASGYKTGTTYPIQDYNVGACNTQLTSFAQALRGYPDYKILGFSSGKPIISVGPIAKSGNTAVGVGISTPTASGTSYRNAFMQGVTYADAYGNPVARPYSLKNPLQVWRNTAYFLKLKNTASGKVEFMRSGTLPASGTGSTVATTLNTQTVFSTTDGDKGVFSVTDYNGNGTADVTFVKTSAGSGQVEVHAADGSNYLKKSEAKTTYFTTADGPNGTWQLGSVL